MLNEYKETLSMDEVAEVLNFSGKTVENLMDQGKIPYFTKKNERYVYKDELIYLLIRS